MVAEIDFEGNGEIYRLELYEENNTINDCDITDVALMQWTGLQDMNGKDIYEGDIVFYIDDFEDVNLVVIRNPNTNQLIEKDVEFKDWCFGRDLRDVVHGVILGNIYENPELLQTALRENGVTK